MENKGCGKHWDDPECFGSFVTKCFEGNLCPECTVPKQDVVEEGK